MTTRGRIARGEHQQEFEGHVQRWVKQWEPLGGTSKVKVLKWVPTGDRSEPPAASQVPHLKTVSDSSLKVVFRPKQAPRPQEQPQVAQETPSSNGVANPEPEQPSLALAQSDAAVPMETNTARADDMQGQGQTIEQQPLQKQQKVISEAAELQIGHKPDEQQAAGASGSAHEPDRALAEEAAQATFAALNAGAGVQSTSTSAEHAAASTVPEKPQLPLAEHAAEASLEAPMAVSAAHLQTTNEDTGE